MNTTTAQVRHKDIGEMNAVEFNAELRRLSGLPLPRKEDQWPAFYVFWSAKTAAELFTDQADRDRWIIDWNLGEANFTAETKRLVEKAIGRPVADDEPRAPMSLLHERRQQREALFE